MRLQDLIWTQPVLNFGDSFRGTAYAEKLSKLS